MANANKSAGPEAKPRAVEPHASLTFCDSVLSSASWRGRIPLGTVDVLLPLFGATAPAPLLPDQPAPREFFEPLAGIAMREMFETVVFRNLFTSADRTEIVSFSRAP
jgi:hypothetical protein